MAPQCVRDVMSRSVISVRPDESLEAVAASMRQHNVSGFPVIDGYGTLVGVVTERDLGRGLSQGKASGPPTSFLDLLAHSHAVEDEETLAVLRARFRRMHVDAVMTREPTVVAPDTPILEAARLIAEKGLHRLPVVEKGKVVGVLSYRDLLATIAQGKA